MTNPLKKFLTFFSYFFLYIFSMEENFYFLDFLNWFKGLKVPFFDSIYAHDDVVIVVLNALNKYSETKRLSDNIAINEMGKITNLFSLSLTNIILISKCFLYLFCYNFVFLFCLNQCYISFVIMQEYCSIYAMWVFLL